MAEENSDMDARPYIVEWLKAHDLTNILTAETKEALQIHEGFTGAALGGVAGLAV